MTHTKTEVLVMIEKARNNIAAGGALVTVTPKTVNAGDARVKLKREPTNLYNPDVVPTKPKPKRDQTKDKVHIRGFY